jgi:hypothetical protein
MRSISSRVFAPAAKAKVAAEWRRSWNRSPLDTGGLHGGTHQRRRKPSTPKAANGPGQSGATTPPPSTSPSTGRQAFSLALR